MLSYMTPLSKQSETAVTQKSDCLGAINQLHLDIEVVQFKELENERKNAKCAKIGK